MTIILAALLLLQDADTGEQFYKFKPGTSWTFAYSHEGPGGAPDKKVVLSVVKQEGAKTIIESREFDGDKETRVEKLVWQAEKEFLTWSEEKDGTLKLVFNLYKLGSKKGDQWDAGSQSERKMSFHHEGTEEVTTGKLTHKGAIRLVLKSPEKTEGPEFGTTLWLVPKTGLVKMLMQYGDAKTTLSLTEFKEGK
jgi:hypothetical protein